MKDKTPRRHVEVNVAELDRIIDDARSAPLSDADSQKLKTARMRWLSGFGRSLKRKKTSAVFDDANKPAAEAPQPGAQTASGYGRSGAAAYRGANKIHVTHAQLAHGDRCPDCARGNVYTQKEPKALVRIVGQAPLAATVYELERPERLWITSSKGIKNGPSCIAKTRYSTAH